MNRVQVGRTDATVQVPGWVLMSAWTVLAILIGCALVLNPVLALVPSAALAAIPLVLSAQVRIIVVVFGALFIFQSSDELTTTKLAYLFALAISMCAALVRLPRLSRTSAFHDLGPMLRASVVMFIVIAASFPASVLNEVPPQLWLRDVAPYVMVACAPIFALDAQASMSGTALRRLLVLGGTIGAVGFTARWLTNRAIADLSFVPIGLPTLLLASTVFVYGISALLHGDRRRLAWAALAACVLAMLLSTGTRTVLVLILAPVVIALGSRQRLTQRSVRLVVAAPLVALLVVVGAQAVIQATNADRDALAGRISLLSSTGDQGTDQSYIDRLAQTAASWDAFRSSPILGASPGTPIPWINTFNEVQTSPLVDSPVSFLAKFGLVGIVAAGFLVIGYLATLRRFRARTGEPTVIQLALVGYGAVIVAWSVLQNPYEDKGFAIGLILLLSLAAREASDSAPAQTSPGARQASVP